MSYYLNIPGEYPHKGYSLTYLRNKYPALKSMFANGQITPDQNSLQEAKKYGYKSDVTKEQMNTQAVRSENTAQVDKNVEEMMGNYPEFQSLIDSSGYLQSPYQLQSPESLLGTYQEMLNPVNENIQYIGDMAKSTELSPYAQAQMELARANETNQRGLLDQNSVRDTSQAFSELAQTGGLDSGARERVARSMGLSRLLGGQSIANQGNINRLGIASNDASQKFNLLGQLPSLQMSTINPYLSQASKEQGYGVETNKYNIDQAIAERQKKRDYELQMADSKNKAIAAQWTAAGMDRGSIYN